MTPSRITTAACLALWASVTPVLAQGGFAACVNGLKSQAAAKGVSAATFAAATRGLEPDMPILELMDNQPEFKTPIWDYLAALVDEERVADGRVMMRKWAAPLAAAEQQFGVDRHVIAAVWGVETNFGRDTGTRPLVRSLATLSCHGRRQAYFRDEFIATLKIIENGDIEPSHLVGSWAGAFGHTQFMPSAFHRLAVDLDGDGRRDVVDSVPDALGSTANFLRQKGWSAGEPWGYEVRLPRGFNAGAAGRRNKRAIASWAALGVTRADGRALSGSGPAGIMLPSGPDGPAFLVTRNFDAIYAYNAAESYGLAIAVLSDRLRGGPGIQAAWPTDDPGLSRAEKRELQRLLTSRGYDVGEADGRIGQKTRDAIKDVERQIGLQPMGRPGAKVLNALKQS